MARVTRPCIRVQEIPVWLALRTQSCTRAVAVHTRRVADQTALGCEVAVLACRTLHALRSRTLQVVVRLALCALCLCGARTPLTGEVAAETGLLCVVAVSLDGTRRTGEQDLIQHFYGRVARCAVC